MTTDITADPLRFAYWVPNVSGGLVTSTIEQTELGQFVAVPVDHVICENASEPLDGVGTVWDCRA